MCPKCIQCHKKIHVLNHLNSLNPKKNLLEFETAHYRKPEVTSKFFSTKLSS